jgi:hypothetical protein
MRHPPDGTSGWFGVEVGKIARLIHRGVCQGPEQRCRGEEQPHDHDAVGQGGKNEPLRDPDVHEISDPPRRRPDQVDRPQGKATQQDPRHGRGNRAAPRPRLRRHVLRQKALAEMPQSLPENGVARLHHQRRQRPEAALRRPEQRPPAQPGSQERGNERDQRNDVEYQVSSAAWQHAEPSCRKKRRQTQQHGGQYDHEQDGKRQLQNIDLHQETARQDQKRMVARARSVVLNVTRSGIDQQLLAIPVLQSVLPDLDFPLALRAWEFALSREHAIGLEASISTAGHHRLSRCPPPLRRCHRSLRFRPCSRPRRRLIAGLS